MILVHLDLMLDTVDLVRQHATCEADHEDHEQTAEHHEIRFADRVEDEGEHLTELSHRPQLLPASCMLCSLQQRSYL